MQITKTRTLLIWIILIGSSQIASGILISIPLEELVKKSDFIVIGTLGEVVEFSKWRTDYSRGTITIEEVLWGKVKPSDKLVLEWRNPRWSKIGRLRHEQWRNKKAVWLLTFDEKGYVRANWFGRARGIEATEEIKKILKSIPNKEVKEFVAVKPHEKLLSEGKPFMNLTTFIITITLAIGTFGFLALRKMKPQGRELALKGLGIILLIPLLFLIVYWHFQVYWWIAHSDKLIWRAAFAAIMAVIFYGTLGLACLVAYRKR